MKSVNQKDEQPELESSMGDLVDFEVEEDLKIFAKLFDSVENTLGMALGDALTVDSSDLSDIHLNDDTDAFDQDDDLESEWKELARVEDSLRLELERQKMTLAKKDEEAGNNQRREYTLYDHYKSLRLEEVKGFGFFCDKSTFFKADPLDCLEFCQPIPDKKLASLYYGLADADKNATLPFRTIAFRIRPDKLGNHVMDSVCNAVAASSVNNDLNLLKRQGGHLRVVVVNEYGPYVVDAQLCIARSSNLQRQLLMRMYYATPKELAEADVFKTEDCQNDKLFEKLFGESTIPANTHLKEACSLVQMMTRLGISGDNESLEKPFPSANSSSEAASTNLRSKFQRSSSVRVKRGRTLFRKKAPLFPSLSKDDWMLLQSSWTLCENVYEGFASTYAFGSLCSKSLDRDIIIPCLDQHYCMLLFQLTEEHMLVELEKSRANLKFHESKGKYVADVFSNLTNPMFEMYNVEGLKVISDAKLDISALSVPKLEEEVDDGSPLFVSLATKALTSSEVTSKENASMQSEREIAEEVVDVVYKAFQSHHSQVQKELVKSMSDEVQNTLYRHRFFIHETYRRLQRAYQHSEAAILEGNKFVALVQQAKNLSTGNNEFSISPFLKCLIQGGECYITETHILLFTNALFQQPRILEMLQSSSALVFPLADISVSVLSETQLRITTKSGDEVLQFCPESADADQLSLFIGIMQSMQHDQMKQQGLV